MYDALLAKLDPASMMEVGGLGKARIAINLLCKASESEPAAAAGGIAAVADGVKVLMQTALLHPEPSLREGAVSVLACCCACNDESFIASALGGGRRASRRRWCGCRRAGSQGKPETEGDEAIDPDLPARRSAVACLHSLLLGTDGAVAIRALRDWSGVAGTPWLCCATPTRRSENVRLRCSAVSSSACRGRRRHAGAARARGPRPRLRRRRSGQGGGERHRRARRRRPGRPCRRPRGARCACGRAPTTASCARHSRMREPRRRSATPRRTTESGSAGLEQSILPKLTSTIAGGGTRGSASTTSPRAAATATAAPRRKA